MYGATHLVCQPNIPVARSALGAVRPLAGPLVVGASSWGSRRRYGPRPRLWGVWTKADDDVSFETMKTAAVVSQAMHAVRFVRRCSFGSCGQDVRFDPFGSYASPKRIHLGSHVYIGRGARISASAGFYVGDYVIVGPELCVMGGDHNFGEIGQLMWDVTSGGANLPVVVEDDCWIGARVTLLKGVTIGRGSVIGAGSVVTRSIAPYSIAAGNPCRVLRRRFSPEQLSEHLEALEKRSRSSGQAR